MNTYYLNLSSNSLTATNILAEISLYDETTLTISLSGVCDIYPILYIQANWGDDDTQILLNDPIKKYKKDSIFPEILEGKISKIYTQNLSHTYRPSSTLYTLLTASLSATYPSNDTAKFLIPIKIRKNDFHENFDEIYLNEVRLVANLNREYQFLSKKDDRIFENITIS
jgi:hypothetical protein